MSTSLFTPVVESLGDSAAETGRAMLGSTGHVKGGSRSLAMAHPKIAGNPYKYKAATVEAMQFVEAILKGRTPIYKFTEAMSTDLFPLLHADTIDRQMYARYLAAPTTWSKYIRRAKVNDFRKVKRFTNTGIAGRLTIVPELAEHPERTTAEGVYEYAVDKYEAGFGLSFEAMVNDDLDLYESLPGDLAQSALITEEYFAARLLADASGPNASYFNLANDNVAASNAALTRASLQAALTRLMKRTDERGNPIVITAVNLVVGPGLWATANDIINATNYILKDGSGNETHISGNGIAANLSISVNFQLPAVQTTANADTSWWLLASPDGPRPLAEMGFLRGYEQPALYEKVPDMRRFGGGAEVAWSFDHGDAHRKVQHILGGSFVDSRMGIASKGDGSSVS
ncbi:Mu-like prophage major head subunit gpT family protein [Actinoplanes sp. NBRC 101535]|uniref:phage major capsid protein n=1 Tax=Actinoplanes sp. NBRC 101535 TaxID=3032196 RepID=UPI0024A4C74B|nr:Mu-like prophage major head subunit gpT family protein [Actinoplanes sp. NBRC 101535]GLY08259.1 hypothetical protein Acsp01_86380 [Actinoplanes sp. NBRC 101535]